jgi:serine/threonine protein kinase
LPPYVAWSECQVPIGTPDYIAPEVLRLAEDAMMAMEDENEDEEDSDPDKTVRPHGDDKKGYGTGVDWWSFGATIYEMSTGRAPFYAKTVSQTYKLVMNCEVRIVCCRLEGC